MDAGEERRQQPVARHGEEDARLAELKTRSTAVCATTDPNATTPTIQFGMVAYFMASVSGSACSLESFFTRSPYGIMPVKTAAMMA